MPDKHRMKLESKSESYNEADYFPILITITICILLVVIFLIYKLFTRVSILATTIAEVNIRLEKINVDHSDNTYNTHNADNTHNEDNIDSTSGIVEISDLGHNNRNVGIKEEISEDLKSMDIDSEITKSSDKIVVDNANLETINEESKG